MRLVSPVALGLLLALGGVAVVTAPVVAAKDKAPAAKLSKEFQAPAFAAQEAAKAGNFDLAKSKLAEAEALAKTPDEIYTLNSIRLNVGIGLKDEAVQRTAVEGMLASGATPAADVPKFEFFSGQFAMNGKDYDGAIGHFKKAVDLGYPGSAAPLLLAESNFQKAISLSSGGQLTPQAKPFAQAGLPYLKRAIDIEKAAGTPVPATWYSRGFSMAYTSGSPDAAEWAQWNLQADPSPKNWRALLRSYRDTHRTLTRGEGLDIMRLMNQTNSLDGEFDYAEYAEAASKSGLLGEVKSVIEKGRASGKLAPTKLADYYTQATGGIAADKASLNPDPAKAASGKAAASTGDAYLGYGEYAKAAALYNAALQKGGVDVPEVTTRLAIALALSGDSAGAKAQFEKVSTGARKDITQFWLLWLSTKQAA